MIAIVRNGALIAAVLLVGGIWWLLFDTPDSVGRKEAAEAAELGRSPQPIVSPKKCASDADTVDGKDVPGEAEPAEDAAEGEPDAEQLTPQELALSVWEKAFDGFVKLQEDKKWKPSEADIAKFKALFDEMDAEQCLEQIPHAQNLFSDASFGFLKAILMDPSEPQDVLESIYHDLLNRPEELKYPVLREVHKVKNHPLRGEIEELDAMLGDLEN